MFLMLFLAIFSLAFLYVYFLNLAVLKTANRGTNLNKLAEIKREIQGLETVYMEKVSKLDLAYAWTLGYVEASPDKFIYRPKTVAQASNYGEVLR